MYHPILLFAMLISYPAIGFILGQICPKYVVSQVPKFINWVGVPILVITSVRGIGLTSELWLIPIIALIAIVLGAVFAIMIIDLGEINERTKALLHSVKVTSDIDINSYFKYKSTVRNKIWNSDFKFRFLIGGALGNTNSIAFPLILLGLASHQIQYFTWAVIFDLFSTMFSLYFIAITAHFIYKQNLTLHACLKPIKKLFVNKIFWSLIIGFFLNSLNLSSQFIDVVNQTKTALIPMCLIAIAMQLKLPKAKLKANLIVKCLLVKMVIIPLVMSAFILALNVKYLPILVILIQILMPPLLIDNAIRQDYNLSQDLSHDFNLAANSIGCAILGFTIPILFVLFS